MKKVTINGKKVELEKIDAKTGWYLLHDLGRICGESLVHASEDRLASAVAELFKNSEKEEVFEMVQNMCQYILVEGVMPKPNDYSMVMKALKELLAYNFEDFFSPLENALRSLTNSQSETPAE